MHTIKGIPIAKGIAHGPVRVIHDTSMEAVERLDCNADDEIQIFHDARIKAIGEIEAIRLNTKKNIGEQESKIFEAHQSILEDPELIGQVEAYILEKACCAEWALTVVGNRIRAIFEAMDNAYMKERAIDIKDITCRVVNLIMGHYSDVGPIDEPYVLVAHDLTPSQTSTLETKYVKGIITEVGGKTAHSAIIATLLKIPYVVVEKGTALLKDGDEVVFDGREGSVIVGPDQNCLDAYHEKERLLLLEEEKYASLRGKACKTQDHIEVELIANISQIKDLDFIIKSDARSVGLFRTEFIFMDQDRLPTEDEQYEIYKKITTAMSQGYVTIRTLDIGGDKESPLFDIPKEDNPFLGYRGIRLCLEEVEIFKTQLRAILRASVHGKIKIMFPMIASLTEIRQAKSILETCKQALDLEGKTYDKAIEVGIMIETPAAVVMADVFAKEVDFFSIGTNDLIQYTMAVDRSNLKISALYSQYDPAVLRNMKIIAEAANKENISVSICGEAAADIKLLPYWLGIGIHKLSMSVALIPEVKWTISQMTSTQGIEVVEALSKAGDVREVLKGLDLTAL
ncbi:phosphotransferase system (PTS) enzyme I [Petrocella atlantisensis]|uniref:Phosphoenolpyruvate-protein phosphotransferase n=1 Tax=Petrocella atlantisensis TaxID=2173034 RepID=A0A3P7S1C7_9FIRM|nr:phosphoenolpyruvate--protein phosphotransferase [Petrocella atlantisensis]VDN48492.1 phosphotransferase system (PTS) enzyme I [Petrocella atlantisensis]